MEPPQRTVVWIKRIIAGLPFPFEFHGKRPRVAHQTLASLRCVGPGQLDSGEGCLRALQRCAAVGCTTPPGWLSALQWLSPIVWRLTPADVERARIKCVQ